MANVRCPMCSKINTPEADTCVYCGARLKPVRPPSGPLSGPPAENPPEEGEPDWLSDLRSDEPAAGPQDEGPAPAGDEDLPDWLSRVRDRARAESASQEVEDTGEADWLDAFEPAGDTPAGVGEDWLDRLSSVEPGERTGSGDQETPDWLSNLSGGAASQPDWRMEETQAEPAGQGGAAGDDADDWMAKLAAWQAEPQEITPAEEPESLPAAEDDLGRWGDESTQPDADIPGWLSDEPAPPEGAGSGETGLPEWISGLDVVPPAAPAAAPEDEQVPAWLDETPGQALPEALEAGAEGLPDWLSEDLDVPGSSAGQPETADLPADEPPSALPDWSAGFSDEAAGPEVAGVGDEGAGVPEPAPAVEPFIDETVPDWLRDFQSQPASEESTPPLIEADENLALVDHEEEPPFAVDLPDWLAEEQAVQPAEAQVEPAVEPEGEEIARADLPEWVKEMRPIEAVIPGEALPAEIDQRVEKAGPLSGLRGVIPAEELTARYRKPPVYSSRLRMSEKQRSQASLLESILSQEPQPLLIPPERSRVPGVLLRVLIALVFLAALAIPRLIQLEPLGLPVLYPQELQDMHQQIEQGAQPQSTVLLAVDYEPGRAGEMHMTALPVVDQLMRREAQIVVISTVPTGPALAGRLLNEAAVARPGYDLAGKTVNLGYLPGGTISLLEFAQSPRLAAPVNLSGDYAVWSSTFLQNVTNMSSFAEVVILTDSAETGRAWVEQVQPVMGDVPLFMVTSAQAAPLLIPYLESQQISGMVSGVLGGAMYSRLSGQEGASQAAASFATYQVGLLLGFGLVLLGGLVSGAVALFKPGQKDEG